MGRRKQLGLTILAVALMVGSGPGVAQAQTPTEAQAQEIPGLALQRALTRNRIRRGRSADIFRIPQRDVPLDLLVDPHLQSFIYPALPNRTRDSPISLDSPTPHQIRSGEAFQNRN